MQTSLMIYHLVVLLNFRNDSILIHLLLSVLLRLSSQLLSFLRQLCLCLILLFVSWSTPQNILELRLLLLQLLKLLVHLLLSLQSLESSHLTLILNPTTYLIVCGHYLLGLISLHVVSCHLFLTDNDSLIIAYARHIYNLSLEFVRSVSVLSLLLA